MADFRSVNSANPSRALSAQAWPSSAAHAARSIDASGSVASTTSVAPGSSASICRFAMASGSGQRRPRASTVVTIASVTPAAPPAPALAAILATGEPERLYTGLSALVSTAVDGDRCLVLATFRSLELLLDPPAGEGRFERSLAELIATARELDALELYACAASVDLGGVTGEPLGGVMSMPRFLRAARGAELVFI